MGIAPFCWNRPPPSFNYKWPLHDRSPVYRPGTPELRICCLCLALHKFGSVIAIIHLPISGRYDAIEIARWRAIAAAPQDGAAFFYGGGAPSAKQLAHARPWVGANEVAQCPAGGVTAEVFSVGNVNLGPATIICPSGADQQHLSVLHALLSDARNRTSAGRCTLFQNHFLLSP